MTNQGEVYFALFADAFDPDELSRRIGIQPTSIQRSPPHRAPLVCWMLSSGRVAGDLIDIYERSSKLIAQLRPHAERIAAARRDMNLEANLQVVLWIALEDSVPMPAIGFDPECIAFLSAVGASVDVDTYRTAPLPGAAPNGFGGATSRSI